MMCYSCPALTESRSPPDGGARRRRGEQMCAEELRARFTPEQAQQKARREHLLGASRQHTLWPVVPPCLAARSAYEHTRATHSYGHGARTQRPSGLRSMPCPLVTEGCRRRLPATQEAWRSSRVAARRTPTAQPEGGVLTTPD